jgi:hypothetical protein
MGEQKESENNFGCGCLALLVFTFLAILTNSPCAMTLLVIGLIFLVFD